MKKLFMAAVLFCIAGTTQAQVEIGLKFSPSVSWNRVTANNNGYTLESDGANVRFGIGAVVDYFFGQNYAFSSGLDFTTKGGQLKYSFTPAPITNPDGSVTTFPTKTVEDDLNIHYLEVPLTLKLFTNDVATDTKLYFQVGGTLGARIAARVNGENTATNPFNNESEKAIKRINLFEAGVLAGAGAEMQLGQQTKAFGGLSYHRGLTGIDKFYEEQLNDSDISLRTDYIALDLGLKF